MTTPAFKSGIDAVDSAIQGVHDKKTSGGGAGEFIYLTWNKDNPTQTIRFITDHSIPFEMHNFVKSEATGKKGSYVCRNQEAFGYAECMFCQMVDPEDKKGRNYRPSTRIISIAALRKVEDVTGPDGQPKRTFVDVPREIKRDEKDIVVPTVGWVEQSPTSFWEPLANAILLSRTYVDRDWQIKRSGEGLSTRYQAGGYDPIEGFRTEEQVKTHYAQWFPQLMDPFKVLSDNLVYRASDEYIERVFYGRNGEEGAGTPEPTVNVAPYPAQQSTEMPEPVAQHPAQAVSAQTPAPAPQVTVPAPQVPTPEVPAPEDQATQQPSPAPAPAEDVPNTAMFRQAGETPATGGDLRARLEQSLASVKK